MKGIILGSDFIEKGDSVKLLETNTNTTIMNEGAELLDYEPLFNVLQQNNITELHFIYTNKSAYLPLDTNVFTFEDKLKEKCSQYNISYFNYVVPENSVTVPYIEDSPNKFILRQSFDTTALVDETYCADKYELLKLLEGSGLTPETYFNSSLGNIDELNELINNGPGVPNLIVKHRYPVYDTKIYPEIYELSTGEELNALKSEIPNDYLIQEFIYDESNLVENRWSVIRSIDIVFGSELDVISLGGYRVSTKIPINLFNSEFIENTKKLNQKTRYKFITKDNGNFYEVTYHVDDDSRIIMGDGSFRTMDNISVNDVLKSVEFTDLNGINASGIFADQNIDMWDGTFEKTVETINVVNTNAQEIHTEDVKALFIRITLENGKSWVDSPFSIFYFEEVDSTTTRWDILNKMNVGDKMIIKNGVTGELSKITITNLSVEYFEKRVYELDVEPYDIFLSDLGDDMYAIMHNNCSCCWGPFYCGNWCCLNYCCDQGIPAQK